MSTAAHHFKFSRNWSGSKRLCGECGLTYDAGEHIEVRVLKPYTNYVCPSGEGRGHSSTWSGSQDVPELRKPTDNLCICGLEFVEDGPKTWKLSWEMKHPGSEHWRPVSVVRSEHGARQQQAGLLELIEDGEPIRSVVLVDLASQDDEELERLRAIVLRIDELANEARSWDLAAMTPVQVGNKLRAVTNGEGARLRLERGV